MGRGGRSNEREQPASVAGDKPLPQSVSGFLPGVAARFGRSLLGPAAYHARFREVPPLKRKRPPAARRKSPDQSLKETAESVVVAFILAFVFRAYVVEAFQIPTGSMAPTLLGHHVRAQCEQCGYAFKSDAGSADASGDAELRCPMCFNPLYVDNRPGGHAGDRILVQKYLYRFAEPKRYDVAVFKNPEDPDTNFIKRLVGLPGETLMLLDGNVYTQPAPHADWAVARKTSPEVNPRWERIQRDVFQPIYHSRYVPEDEGAGVQRRGAFWTFPWQPDEADDTWDIDLASGDAVVTWAPDAASAVSDGPDQSASTGALRFDFSPHPDYRSAYHADYAMYPYNQPGGSGLTRTPLEDLRLAVTVTPSTDDVSVTLSSLARLDGPPVPVHARFAADGTVELVAGPNDAVVRRVTLPPFLQANDETTLEFWVVDQSFLLWIDGEVALRHEHDLAYDQLVNRPNLTDARGQDIRVTLTGSGGATLRDLELDRDLFYDDGGVGFNYRAGLPRAPDGRVSPRFNRAVTLEPDHFFMVGDNAPHSEDSRKWVAVHPAVANQHFAGRRGPEVHGRVPRNLLMGRAFLVYYPAPQSITENGRAVLPNLGEIRFIH